MSDEYVYVKVLIPGKVWLFEYDVSVDNLLCNI